MTEREIQEMAGKAFEKIAAASGKTVSELRAQLEALMGKDMRDPANAAAWEQVPRKGDRPTPEEYLAYIAELGRSKREPE